MTRIAKQRAPWTLPDPIRRRSWRLVRGAMVLLWALIGGASAHADVAEIYRGKTISLVVNFTSGGPTDTEARILARHLGKHIPGEPTIVVRNMGGAGGMIGANWIGQVAPRDGLTLGYLTALAVGAAQGNPALKIDPTTLPFISGVESVSVYYGRTDTGAGLLKPEDILSKKDFWVGGLTPDSSKDINLRAELELLGVSHKYISGYPGAAEVRMALEKNEVQVTSESLPTFRMSINPALVQTGKAIPLWYDTSRKFWDKGHPDAIATGAMPFAMFYRKMKGEPPDTPLWRMNALVAEFSTSLLRTIHLPPNPPPGTLEAMRKAVGAMAQDTDYRAEAEQVLKFVPGFSLGPEAEEIFLSSARVDPEMSALIRSYVEKGYAMIGK